MGKAKHLTACQSGCFIFTTLYYAFAFLLIAASIVYYVFTSMDNEYDDIRKLNLIGSNDKEVQCGKGIFEHYKTFQYKRSDTSYNFQCAYNPTVIYMESLAYITTIFVFVGMTVSALIFKRASYAFGFYMFGGFVGLFTMIVIVLQVVHVVKGYNYCTDTLSPMIQANNNDPNSNVTVECSYDNFLIDVVLEFAIVCLFVCCFSEYFNVINVVGIESCSGM